MTVPNLTCREFVELVTEYLEGTMPAEERARFDAHMAVCPGCQDYLDQMRQTIQATGHLSEESIAPATRDHLLTIFRDWKRGR